MSRRRITCRRGAVALAALLACLGSAACGGSGASVGRFATTSSHRRPKVAGAGAAATTTTQRRMSPSRAQVAIPDGDWPQFGYTDQRSDVGPSDTGIDAANLPELRRRTVRLPATADSSAVYLHDVRVEGRRRDAIFLTTSYGRTLAIDPASGRVLWQFTPRDIGAYAGSYRFTTATPTVDPDRRYLYATSPDGYVHKLAVATGRPLWAARVTLSPQREKLASPPSIAGGWLIVVTGGYYGDTPPYQGHVVAIDRASGRIEAVFNTLCSNRRGLIRPSSCAASDSAIWGRAGAVIEPDGKILVATGNGPFNGRTDWGDSVLELSRSLRLAHNFTPRDQAQLQADDLDLGSTSPALLPDPGGPPLAVQGGKSGELLLLDLDRLDGSSGRAGPRTGGQLQTIAAPGRAPVFAQPAAWEHGGRSYLFVADGAGTACYELGRDRRLHVAWEAAMPGTSPVLAGGLLYVYDELGGTLAVRNPLSGRLLGRLPAAPGHWNSPIVLGGRIILPVGGGPGRESSPGLLYIYHLPGR